MIKKFFITILAVLYLAVSCGATVQVHYCMGRLISWDLWRSKDKDCAKCGMQKLADKDNGCCRDEHKQIKLDQDQKTTEISHYVMALMTADLPVSFIDLSSNIFLSFIKNDSGNLSPPRSQGIAVYIRNCVFRI
jgi:hypothetical protein